MQNHKSHEDEVVGDEHRILAIFGRIITEQKERNKSESHEDRYPQYAARNFGQIFTAIVADHCEQIEQQKTGERHEVVVWYEIAGLFYGAEHTRKHGQTDEEHQKCVQAHWPNGFETFKHLAGAHRFRFGIAVR